MLVAVGIGWRQCECACALLCHLHRVKWDVVLWQARVLPCAQTAIEAGEFREDPGDPGSPPSVPAVLSVASDIVAGMAFLHERKILHGDLTCSAHPLACWLL